MPTIVWAITQVGSASFIVPAHVASLKAMAIGGAAGASTWNSPISPKSGGGGAFAQVNAAAVTPGQSIPYHVGAGGLGTNDIFHFPGEDTWLGNSDINNGACICLAQAAFNAFQSGGQAQFSKGDIKFNGGAGNLNILNFGPGAAGGGAGGPNGAGINGQPGSPDSTTETGYGSGGAGNNGLGGAGGVWVQNHDGASGANGSEITLTGDAVYINGVLQAGKTFTFGSGGGGASGIEASGAGGSGLNYNGGNGGLYGGGGGTAGGTGWAGVVKGGNGAQGILVLIYSPTPQPRSQVHIYG